LTQADSDRIEGLEMWNEKNTVARRFGGWEGLCFCEEGGSGQIIVENKTVEMVVKDLLLADNQKKKCISVF